MGERAVVAGSETRLTLSVSDLESPGYRGTLHGSYSLENDSLDARLR